MTGSGTTAIGRFVRFAMVAAGVTIVIAALGYVPTRRLGGPDALPGMAAGCAISLIASLIGAIPLALRTPGDDTSGPLAALTATGVRFLVVLMLALSAALSGWFDRPALLIWVAISYLLLLVADTTYAVRMTATVKKKDAEQT